MKGEKIRHWAVWIGIVLSVPVALNAAMDFWNFVQAPSENVVAEVTYGSFELPQELIQDVESLYGFSLAPLLKEKLDLTGALSFIDEESDRELALVMIRGQVSSFLNESLPNKPPSPYHSIRGYWSVTLTNEGSTTLKSVALTLPDAVYSAIEREGEPINHRRSNSIIHFDSVPPQESIEIYAWASTRPTRYNDVDVKLVHSNGVGTVSFRVPVGPFWVFMEQYWPNFAILFGWLLGALVYCAVSKNSSKPTTESKPIESSHQEATVQQVDEADVK